MRSRWIALPVLVLLPGALAQRMGFELAHGIGSGYEMFQETMTTPNGGGTLEQYLQKLDSVARVQGVTCDTKTFDVNRQVYENACQSYTTSYAKSVSQLAQNVDKIVLVGHSQGGLRSREFLQSVGDRNGDFSLARSKVTGLVTMGSPLNGAAIAQNAPGFAAWNIGLLFASSMSSSFWASGQASVWQGPAAAMAAAVVPILITNHVVNDLVGAGRGDMSPNSAMVGRHTRLPA
jgi:triacylglycerol esterase/lipase EstA (alpha/beta hydrolase family)